MHSRFLQICLSLINIALISGCNAQPVSYSQAVEKRIQQVESSLMGWVQTQDTMKWTLKERMAFYKIRGLSIAIVNDYKTEWAKGYGWADTMTHQLVTPQTLFQAASMSKSLNALGIMKLVQDRQLDLETDINQYLKSWQFPYDSVSKNKKITMAQLLSHTAGLTVHGFPGYAEGDDLPGLTDILDGNKPANTSPIRSQFEPGLRFQYSGGGTTISQLVVTDITNKSYSDFMWENVLKPLGMTNSFFDQPPPDKKLKLLATGYYADGRMVNGKFHVYPEQAAAGLWTNPGDMCRYLIETQLSYEGKSENVLTSEMTRMRLKPYGDGQSAMGVFIDDRKGSKFFQHSGANEGFTCMYIGSLDQGKGVVVMTNSEHGGILEEIANSVASVYDWKNFYTPVFKTIINVPDSVTYAYEGKYSLDGEPVTIEKGNVGLVVKYRNVSFRIFFTSDIDFFMLELKGDNQFQFDNEGKVTGFTIGGGMMVKRVE